LACTFSLKFHQRGVQSLSFSNQGRFLVSLGVRDDNMVAVWDAEQGSIVSYTHVSGGAHN
jgi:WD40 repeat protein